MDPNAPAGTDVRHAVVADGSHTVVASGEIDVFTASLFEDALERAAGAPAVVVDLRECRYIDSAAVAALIRLRKRTTGEIRLLINGHGAVARVIELTKLHEIVTVES